ncbi:hypothetical protein F7734_49550 [Scytonema sp. UIC 10036]|uniref:hypothetical protein n=1 Tax=Scytonema sp. UIC 10036 TaxID=2304196 RepID=UPI0012DA8A9F|nr:hypothetical protein [Scytonema sp. UIC 10036]MUG99898.1 hypothetical protein [Scytonema sp. UIC 10036]
MPPKISDSVAWQQAEILMQPAFIRVVDNIRKLLDVSSWTGTYQDVLIWPTGTTDETQAIVTKLLQDLEAATPEQALEIRETLSILPMPHPGYHLCLQRQEQQVSIDLWELCYQVCFLNYIPGLEKVEIDTSLIDETGDVDWQILETKTKQVVERVFGNLPE